MNFGYKITSHKQLHSFQFILIAHTYNYTKHNYNYTKAKSNYP